MPAIVLVVDTDEAARVSIRRILEEADIDVRVLEAADGDEALSLALGGEVDIVVSELASSTANAKLEGLQLLRAIREQRDAETLPVILVTVRADEETRALSFDAGVNDYLSKPFSSLELLRRIHVQLRVRGLQEELRRANERFRILGAHDELTGLANRRHFFDLCRRELARSRRHRYSMAIAVLDIDDFREVNTRVGYLVGDAIISEVATVLSQNLRSADTLARIGGEKFAVLLPQTEMREARTTCDRLCEAVRVHTFSHRTPARMTVSAGSAIYPSGGIESIDELVNAAEASLDRAKELGGGRVELWDAAAGG